MKKALRYSTINGVFASMTSGFANEYLTPFLLLLGGTVTQVGALNALPNIAASLTQLKSADITERLGPRQRIVILFTSVQAVILLFLATAAVFRTITPFAFIAVMILFSSCAALVNPAWGSWLSDLVDQARRGEFFGWRYKTLGLVAVGSTLVAGVILHWLKKANAYYGFAILFGAASLFMLAGCYFFKKIYEPPLAYSKETSFTIVQFLSRLKESNFAKFVLFASAMSFSVNIASPYFAVLMLRDLKFGYLLYTLITISSTLTMHLIMTRWGRLADRIGNIRIIRFAAPLTSIIPLFWILNRHPLFLICAQLFAGFVWAGLNLCMSNFIYDAVTPEKRTRCIAYFNVFNGLMISAGALLGGFILRWLPPLFGYKILTLFFISSALRTYIGLRLPLKLKEVRTVEKMHSNQLFFNMINTRALLGVDRRTIRY